jgi:hypothetical protein
LLLAAEIVWVEAESGCIDGLWHACGPAFRPDDRRQLSVRFNGCEIE